MGCDVMKTFIPTDQTFYLLTQWINYNETTLAATGEQQQQHHQTFPTSVTIRRRVCELAEKCRFDVREEQEGERTSNKWVMDEWMKWC